MQLDHNQDILNLEEEHEKQLQQEMKWKEQLENENNNLKNIIQVFKDEKFKEN